MSSSSKTMICFNTECREAKPEQFGKGWRLRNGSFCPLCNRCAAAFEEGKFCDTFHLDAAGWRNCESCGKRIHCGCVVSMYAYILLDAGGVDCMACASKNIILATNQVWPPPSSMSLPVPDGLKDLPVKSWNPIAPQPSNSLGNWPPIFNMRNTSAAQSTLNPRMQYDIDVAKHIAGECSAPVLEKKLIEDRFERLNYLSNALMDRLTNGNAAADMVTGCQSLGRDESSLDGFQGMTYKSRSNARLNSSLRSASSREDPSNSHLAAPPYSLPVESNGLSNSVTQPQERTSTPPVTKHINANFQNGMDSSGETPKRNARLQVDARGRSQVLPRYRPKITDQELQEMSGDQKSVVTPLFEKMLSASDAGRVGRLVLPKKCAEAYLPTITHSEGLPLTVQDAKGKEWVLHFRFWPNNNSRMYVLEGVTPCIQSMQLQAGDTVTFSRLDPEGKLIMGFRKAGSAPPPDQAKRSTKAGADVSKNAEVDNADPAGSWHTDDKSGCIAKHVGGSKSPIRPGKRTKRCLAAKSKRLRIDHEDILELMLTLEKTQILFRPPPDNNPDIMKIDDYAFEEYEEAPIFGKPTIYTTDEVGEKIQWAQCEDCSKWRKLPISALLPSRWTCSANLWDPKRSSCSSAQEVTSQQLEDIVASDITDSASVSRKSKPAKEDTDAAEFSKGLGILADLVTPVEKDTVPSSAQTTRHPRHRSGCTCIVCIQPPSGKPRHKDTCVCSVCLSQKRRRLSLMKHLSERNTETARKKLEELQLPDNSELEDALPGSDPHQNLTANEKSDNDPVQKNTSSPVSGPIDLNIQPEREDVPSSTLSYSNSMVRLVSGNHKLFPRPHRPTSSQNDGDEAVNNPEPCEGGEGDIDAGGEFDRGVQHNNSPETGNDAPDVLCISNSASMPACS